jgi:hypothetical protein
MRLARGQRIEGAARRRDSGPHVICRGLGPCTDNDAGMAGAHPIDRPAGGRIDRLAIDKHSVAGFNAEAGITGIGCDEIGQQ